jgi:hypothetical protein
MQTTEQIKPKQKPQSASSVDVESFANQSFYLLFCDEFANMPQKLMKIFKGDLKKEFGNKDFLESTDMNVVHLKHIILQSARLAFHWSFESFVMGELELTENKEFIVSIYLICHIQFLTILLFIIKDEIETMDKQWYLGSEEYLWNAAIERNLPNMERLIQKDG